MLTARIFVYGTLKQGFWNHDRYCRGAISVEEATVLGRLYRLPSGIPALMVPERSILAHGSADILADLALQRCLMVHGDECLMQCVGEWRDIEGELITLSDPARVLPPIDRLEGFHPDHISLYKRVLVAVMMPDNSYGTAWCYVAGPATAGTLCPTSITSWR